MLQRTNASGPADLLAHLHALVKGGANAILAAPPYCEVISRNGLAADLGIPVIAMSAGDALPNLVTVRIDDFAAARDMTRHLLGLGHRRIGFIRAPETHIIAHTRQDGYRAALEEAGIAFDRALVAYSNLSYESGLVAAAYLLDFPQPPTAIFASTDDMAAAVVSVGHRRGLTIPGALSVAGFDDGPLAVKLWPTLTTIRQPIAAIAARAATMAIQSLRQGANAAPVTGADTHYLDYELIQRESTGSPA
jgi:LacI family transcriptional regulator